MEEGSIPQETTHRMDIAPGVDVGALVFQLMEEKMAMQRSIDALTEEVRRLTDLILSKTAPTQIPPTPQQPHPHPESPTAPNPKRAKTAPKPKPNIPSNLPLPISNAFHTLLTHPDTDTNMDFPPPPTTRNDPTAQIPTKLTTQRSTQPRTMTQQVPPTVTPLFSTSAPVPKPTDTVPPIILHSKDNWVQVSRLLTNRKAHYTHATNTREGIRIAPTTIQDYRAIHDILSKEDLPFHSFQLPSERTIKVVLRGVPQTLSNEDITKDLTEQSYIPLQVARLNGRNNRPAPLILVQVERKFQSIFNLKTLCGLDITVEAKKVPSGPLQCHRCQRFGHTQPNCHAPFRCMKCAESHSTHLCPKPITTPAVCANCDQAHISSHHSCSQNPINLKKSYSNALKPSNPAQKPTTTQTPNTQPPKPQIPPKPNTKTPTPAPAPAPTPKHSFASAAFPLFELMLANNPSPALIHAFTTQITHLKQILQ